MDGQHPDWAAPLASLASRWQGGNGWKQLHLPQKRARWQNVQARRFSGSQPPRGRTQVENVWISMVVRDGRLVGLWDDYPLTAGDELVILAEPDRWPTLDNAFSPLAPERPRTESGGAT